MTGRSWRSAAVAALFAVHPMHVESVVWVAERKDVLSTFLGLLTLLVYVRYSRKADLANDSLIVFAVLCRVHLALDVASCLELPFAAAIRKTSAVGLLWIYVPIFAGIAFYAVMTGRYNLLLYCLIFVLVCARPAGQADAGDAALRLPVVGLLAAGPFSGLCRADAAGPGRTCRPERPARRRGGRPSETSACRPGKQRPPRRRTGSGRLGTQVLLLLLEKVPLLALSAASAVITPYAQAHGGSMASASDLSLGFRLENSLQSYLTYITQDVLAGQDVGALPARPGQRRSPLYGPRGRRPC